MNNIASQLSRLLEEIHSVVEVIVTWLSFLYLGSQVVMSFRRWKQRYGDVQARRPRFQWSMFPWLGHSLGHEVAILFPIGLLLNLPGVLLQRLDPDFPVFLDMAGTFAVALVLGPWWGALLGFLTNVLVAIPPINMEKFLPFAVVQVVAAVFWGYAMRHRLMSRALASTVSECGCSLFAFIEAVLFLGTGAAVLTAIVGGWTKYFLLHENSAILTTFYHAVPIEIASKITAVVIGALFLRTLFPIYLRARDVDVRRSGILPPTVVLIACGYLMYNLPASVDSVTEALWARVWVLLLPMLGMGEEIIGAMIRFNEKEKAAIERRLKIYGRLKEVSRDSDRVYRSGAIVMLLVAFVLPSYLGGPGDLAQLHLAVVVAAAFLLFAWTLEVAARHNRLEQLFVFSGGSGTRAGGGGNQK